MDTEVFRRARERAEGKGPTPEETAVEREAVQAALATRDPDIVAKIGGETLARHPDVVRENYLQYVDDVRNEKPGNPRPEAVPAMILPEQAAEQAGFTDRIIYADHQTSRELIESYPKLMMRLPEWAEATKEILPLPGNRTAFVVNDHGGDVAIMTHTKHGKAGTIQIITGLEIQPDAIARLRELAETLKKSIHFAAIQNEKEPVEELVSPPANMIIDGKKWRVERAEGDEYRLMDENGDELTLDRDGLAQRLAEGRAEVTPGPRNEGDEGQLELLHAGLTPREMLRAAAPKLAEKIEAFQAEADAIARNPEAFENPGKWYDGFKEWAGRRAERFDVELPGVGKKIADIIRLQTTRMLVAQQALQKETLAKFGRLTGGPKSFLGQKLVDVHKWGRETLFEVAKGVRGLLPDGRLEFGTKQRSGRLKLEKKRQSGELFIETDDGPVPFDEVRGSYVTVGGEKRLVGEEIKSVFERKQEVPLLPGKKAGDEVAFKGDIWTVKETGPTGMVLVQRMEQPTGYVQLYRELDPEKYRAMAEDLFDQYPEAEQILKDYVAKAEEIKETALFGDELPAFAREVLKRQFAVNGMEDVEGAWVPEMVRDKTRNLGRAIRNVFRPYKSPHRRYKTGALDKSPEVLRDLGEATFRARTSFLAEEFGSEMSGRILELIAKPYDPARGAELLPGYKPLTTGILSPDGFREVRVMRRATGLLERAGIDPKSFDQAVFQARGVPYQVPSKIAEELQAMFNVKPESTSQRGALFAKAFGDVFASLIQTRNKTLLTRPSTTVRNALSQSIQTVTMGVHDLWKGVFDKMLTDNPAPFAELKGSLYASLRHIGKEARQRYPDPLLGGRFVDQFRREARDIDDWLLMPFHEVETGQKRFIFQKSHFASAYREAAKLQAEGKLPEGYKARYRAALEMMEKPLPEGWFSQARDDIMWHGYDYADAPKAMQWFNRFAWSRGLVPYPNYVYHMARMVLERYDPLVATPRAVVTIGKNTMEAWKAHRRMTDPKGWDLQTAKNRADVADKLANMMTSWTMWGLAAWLTEPPNDEEKQARALTKEGARLPYNIDTSGRLLVGENDDKEYWVRVADQPFIAETAALRAAFEGRYEISDYLDERVSLGVLANTGLALLGYRDKYSKEMPAGAILGREAAASIKYSPWLHFARRMQDPHKRKGYDTKKGFGVNFGMAFGDYMPFTSNGLPERRGMYDPEDTMLKHGVLNFKVIDTAEKQDAIREAIRRLRVREIQDARAAAAGGR